MYIVFIPGENSETVIFFLMSTFQSSNPIMKFHIEKKKRTPLAHKKQTVFIYV